MKKVKLYKKFFDSKLVEANRGKVFKAAKKGSYPAVIVVTQDGKVIHQEPVSTPEVAPATFNVMQEKYPKALLHLEDNTGKRLFSESILNEYSSDVEETKMFEQSTVTKIIDDIKKLLDWKDKQYGNQRFDYSEYRFASGSGGFSFKWDHARNWGGQIGVSFDEKSGNHKYYAYSWYDKKLTGSATADSMKPFKFKGNPVEWKDFNNDHLLEFWKKVKGDIKKNEAGAKAALDREAKGQSDHYGAKADTGRIGYGL